MPDRTNRQLRALPTEFRAEARDNKKYIEGYFAVFGSDYELWAGATESVDPHAFDDTISGDVRALIDHETRLVIGRTKAGTLTLRVDSHGLWGSIEINENDSDAMNLWYRVQRGDVDQCSFGFDILEERTDWSDDGNTVHWTLMRVKLYEVSCVTFPAYEDTSVSARKSEFDAESNRRQTDALVDKMKRRLHHYGTQAIDSRD